MITHLFAGWAQHDPAAAVEGAVASDLGMRIANYATESRVLGAIFQQLSSADPALATELATKLARTSGRGQEAECALGALASWHYEHGGSAAVLSWLGQLPPDVNCSGTLGGAVEAAVDQKDIKGASEILCQVGLENVSGWTVLQYAEGLANTDPQTARDWVLGLTPGDVQSHAFRGVLSASLDQDLSWLSRLPTSPQTDALLIDYADSNAEVLPGKTDFQIASYISNPADRNRVMQKCALAWLSRDPESAREGLPPNFVKWWDQHNPQVNASYAPPF